MKSKSYKISIPEPCHQNWSGMTPNEKGRFCQACAKTVVDFSTWSDEDILKYLQRSKGGTCGRMSTTQLSRSYRKTSFFEKHIYKNLIRAAAFLLLLLKLKRSDAQVGKWPVKKHGNCKPQITTNIGVKGEVDIRTQAKDSPVVSKEILIENEMVDGGMWMLPEEDPATVTGDTTISAVDTTAVNNADTANDYEWVKNADGVMVRVKKNVPPPFELPLFPQIEILGGVMMMETFPTISVDITSQYIWGLFAPVNDGTVLLYPAEDKKVDRDTEAVESLLTPAPSKPVEPEKHPPLPEEKSKALLNSSRDKKKKL
jgi:hypothetical protein